MQMHNIDLGRWMERTDSRLEDLEAVWASVKYYARRGGLLIVLGAASFLAHTDTHQLALALQWGASRIASIGGR